MVHNQNGHGSGSSPGSWRPSLTTGQASQVVFLHSSLNPVMVPTWVVQRQVVHTSIIRLFPGWKQRRHGQAYQHPNP